MSIPAILTQPVEELLVSAELSSFMNRHHMNALQSVVEHPADELLAMEGFSYHCLVELYRLLRAHRCEAYLKEV